MTLSLQEATGASREFLRPLRDMLFDRFFDGSATPKITLEEAVHTETTVVRLYDPVLNLALRYGFNARTLRALHTPSVMDAVAQGLDVLEMQWRQARFYADLCAFARPEPVAASGGFVFREADR